MRVYDVCGLALPKCIQQPFHKSHKVFECVVSLFSSVKSFSHTSLSDRGHRVRTFSHKLIFTVTSEQTLPAQACFWDKLWVGDKGEVFRPQLSCYINMRLFPAVARHSSRPLQWTPAPSHKQANKDLQPNKQHKVSHSFHWKIAEESNINLDISCYTTY